MEDDFEELERQILLEKAKREKEKSRERGQSVTMVTRSHVYC